jgi:hypothetical protein
MLGSLRVGRWGATSKIGFDHVGEDDARLGDVEGGDGRVHLVEALAAAQKFGIDRADFVEHLAQFAEVGECGSWRGSAGLRRGPHSARNRPAGARRFD